jgi:hypothetical protein
MRPSCAAAATGSGVACVRRAFSARGSVEREVPLIWAEKAGGLVLETTSLTFTPVVGLGSPYIGPILSDRWVYL